MSRLNSLVREKLNDLISRGCTILVGDANGADKAVQRHLADGSYQKVVVYCMDNCRNNVGGWETRRVRMPDARRDFAYCTAKDLAMAQDAKCGVMLWDGKSTGTLNNIHNLIRAGKKTLVYLAPDKTFYKLSSEQDLRELLQRCHPGQIQQAQRRLRDRLSPAEHQLTLQDTRT